MLRYIRYITTIAQSVLLLLLLSTYLVTVVVNRTISVERTGRTPDNIRLACRLALNSAARFFSNQSTSYWSDAVAITVADGVACFVVSLV